MNIDIKQLRNSRRVAVMGGTFDPIHYGHLAAAEAVRHAVKPDLVLFVVAGQPPHKNPACVTDGEHRYNMALLATADNPFFEVTRIELDKPGVSYTVDTLRLLRENCPIDAEIFFVIGADTVPEIDGWREAETLLSMCRLIAVARPGYPWNTRLLTEKNIMSLDVPGVDISGTAIRTQTAIGRPIRYLLPPAVEQYIYNNKLYVSTHKSTNAAQPANSRSRCVDSPFVDSPCIDSPFDDSPCTDSPCVDSPCIDSPCVDSLCNDNKPPCGNSSGDKSGDKSCDKFSDKSCDKFSDKFNDKPTYDKDALIQAMAGLLSAERFSHTMGVAEEAVRLAKHYGADAEKAWLAGLLHDCAKEYSRDKKRALCQLYGVALDEVTEKQIDLTHSALSAESARYEYGVHDEEILQAIRYHTTGHGHMTLMDKIVMLADFIEPTREDYPGLEKMRAIALSDLNGALRVGIKQTIAYNKKKGRLIHPDGKKALRSLKNKA